MTAPTLHVAHVLLRFPSVTETFVHQEAEDLDGDGMKVHILALRRQRVPVLHDAARRLSSQVHRALTPAAPLHLLLAAIFRLRPTTQLLRGAWTDRPRRPGDQARHWGAVLAGFQLASACRKRKIHHIHAAYAGHTATAARIASRLAGIPYSCTAHAHDIFNPSPGLEKRIRDAAFVRCVTEFNQRHLLRLVNNFDPKRLPVIRCGVEVPENAVRLSTHPTDPPRLEPGDEPSGSNASSLRLLAVAQLRPYKALDVLIDALDILRWRNTPVVATVAGTGPLGGPLGRRAERSGIEGSLVFHGAVRQEKLSSLHHEADIYVATGRVEPSGKMDGFPVALLEAMAAGLPVVATRISGVGELVRHRVTGLLVPPNDAGALADAIDFLRSNPAESARMATAGRQIVRLNCDPGDSRRRLRACVLATHGRGSFPATSSPRFDVTSNGMPRANGSANMGVRRLLVSDRDAVVEVLARTWGPRVARDRRTRWDWLHLDNPHDHPGGSPAFVLERHGEVVGCMLGVAAPLWWEGRTFPMAWIGASAVLPAFRGRGRSLLDQTRESLGIMSGVPTPRMARLWARVDRHGELWQGPPRSLLVRPLGPGAGASFRLRPFEATKIERFDASWDRCLREWTATWHATLARSQATCNWLLLDDPATEQAVVGIFRGGKPTGYAAIRLYENESGERRAAIADLLAPRGDVPALRAGVTAAMTLARHHGASALTLREPMHPDHVRAFRGLGFLKGRTQPLSLVVARAPGPWPNATAGHWWQVPDTWADPRIF